MGNAADNSIGAASASAAVAITAAILVIGDEILSGRTKDKNIGYIAEHLCAIGIELCEVRIVPDVEARIIEALDALRAQFTYVFTTGGIGPTHDDITADAIAKAFGVAIDVDPRALALMQPHYASRGMELTPARLRMARLPEGSTLIENRISVAPGFVIGNVIVMAGVPAVMQVMLDAVTPSLRTGRKMLSTTVAVTRPEGDVAPVLSAAQLAHDGVSMGSYPFFRDQTYGTQLVLRSLDQAILDIAEADLRVRLSAAGLL